MTDNNRDDGMTMIKQILENEIDRNRTKSQATTMRLRKRKKATLEEIIILYNLN